MIDLAIEICGIELEHPVINGSGTFDAIKARALRGGPRRALPVQHVRLEDDHAEPRAGNPPPRLYETPAGMINSIGLPNKGLEGFIESDLPELAELPVPLFVSVMATSREGFATLVAAVATRRGRRDRAQRLVPQRKSGLIVGEQPRRRARSEALRELTAKPLIVKLTPNSADPAAVAAAAEEAERRRLADQHGEGPADDRGGAVARRWQRRALGTGGAGDRARSGAAGRRGGLDPGDRHGRDRVGAARAGLPRAGASVVAVGTANFRDPMAGKRVRTELGEGKAKSRDWQLLTAWRPTSTSS